MLYPAKRPKNRDGSVLLAVVVMTLVLMSLATISLNVVHATTLATSRNVQRTQAKITAEAALQEFINGYKAGETHNGTVSEDMFNKLRDLASLGTPDSPYIYKVGFNGVSDADFAQQFGETEIHLYKIPGTGAFKAEAITTFSTQTQKASITFAANTITQSTPSNTVESKKGNAVGGEQLSMGIEGNLHYENENGANIYKKISRCVTKSHVYCEMSVLFDDQTLVTDVYNKSIDNVYKKDNRYFYQAPTVTVDGYVAASNNVYLGTWVGKSDINAANSTYSGGYDASHLGGYDGYLCVYKKILAWTNARWSVGCEPVDVPNFPSQRIGSRPMDVYCRGYYDGELCNSLGVVDGVDFGSEINSIKSIYSPQPCLATNMQDQSTRFYVNGDMHVYKNDAFSPTAGECEISENGALVIASNNSLDERLYITGDLYIDGDIFIISNNSSIPSNMIVIGGTLHMPSSCKIHVSLNGVMTQYNPGAVTSGVPGITVSGYSDTVDKDSQGRHHMPEKGYLATIGDPTNSNTRTRLSKSYELASSNDIFTMSVAPAGYDLVTPNDVAAAQNIASKYATAMTRNLESIYTNSSGEAKRVSQHYANIENNAEKPITQINASVKLSVDEAARKYNNKENNYLINLYDEDIVIALPLGDFGATFKVLSNYDANNVTVDVNGNRIRPQQHFVYFMWYYPDDESQCLYFNNASLGQSYADHGLPAGGSPLSIPTLDGGYWDCIAMDASAGRVVIDPVSGLIIRAGDGSRRAMKIHFGSSGTGQYDRFLVSDYRLTLPEDKVLNASNVNDPVAIQDSIIKSFTSNTATARGQKIDNCIMFLVPDYVEVQLGDVNCVSKCQGVVYAWNSQVSIPYTSNFEWYGQIKADRFKWDGDATGVCSIKDLPMGEGSLLSYASRNESGLTGTSKIEIQYYEY